MLKIKPKAHEIEKAEAFARKLSEIAGKTAKVYGVKPMICGSYAKNTWLAEKNEFDMFLLFNPLTSRKQMEQEGLDIAKSIVKDMKGSYKIAYAEHPYARSSIKSDGIAYSVDLVPAYEIKDPRKIQSAVDRTPHHVIHVNKHLKFPDEARLLKQFCKAAGCYGADTKTQGFSGYLCELLIISYGSFELLIKNAAKWRVPVIVDEDRGLFKKFKAPLILIDPVDPNRNVSAAVSIESFYRFVKQCKEFMERPSAPLFFPERLKPYTAKEVQKELRKRGTRWYALEFERPDVVDDILWPQLRRCSGILEKMAVANGFRCLRRGVWADEKKCIIVLEMDIWSVPAVLKKTGPDIYTKHADDFLKHYKNEKVFIEDGKWVVERESNYIAMLHLLQDLIGFSEKKLLESGIPSKLSRRIREAKLYGGGNFIGLVKSADSDFGRFLRSWFEEDMNVV